MKPFHGDLRNDRNNKQGLKNLSADQITEIHRHGYGDSASFAKGCGKNFYDSED